MKLADRIKKHEGLRLSPYMDTKGHLTIGYGHCIKGTHIIDKDVAEALFEKDLAEATAAARSLEEGVNLNSAREGVIIEMCYQLGRHGVWAFQKMWSCLKKQDYLGASMEMLNSAWGRECPARVKELALIMETGNV